MRITVLLLAAIFLLAPAWGTAAQKPNIILFLMDDLGQTDLGCYGSTFYETPHLDRLAQQGLRFTQAYAACPVCSPTRAAVLTGKYPLRTGVTDYINPAGGNQPANWKKNTLLLPAPYADRLPLAEITLAEVLKSTGYHTFHAGKWHLGPQGFYPEDQGFDINKGGAEDGAPRGPNKYFSPYTNPRLTDGPPGEYLTDRLATETISFVRAHRDQPFFVYFPFYAVHTPLMAPESLVKKYEEKRQRLGLHAQWGREGERRVLLNHEHPIYAAMVESMDTAIGRVLQTLDELKLNEQTIVLFTSDNGGLSTSEGHPTANLPLRAGKGWLYEGGIRVPLIIRWTGKFPAGKSLDTPVSSIDYFPTFLDLADVHTPQAAHVDGISLKELILHDQQPATRDLFWHYPHYGNQGGAPGSVLRHGDWKLILWEEGPHVELFNLKDDPSEKQDVAGKHPSIVRDMRARLEEFLTRNRALHATPNPAYNPAQPNGRGEQFKPNKYRAADPAAS
ncbi:MAG: sulfatase [Planctomycetales bacterium]